MHDTRPTDCRPRPRRRIAHRRAAGVTIIELLTAISIIVLLIGITFPVLSVLRSGVQLEAALNTVGMAADVARQYVDSESWENDGGLTAPTEEKYNGTAAIYCPTGEVRIVSNISSAKDPRNDRFLEDYDPKRNGYADVEAIDYVRITRGIGVAGILRSGSGGAVSFIAPPFAIAFTEGGNMNFGDDRGKIYYDADGDGKYNIADRRRPGYNPKEWDGESSDANNVEPNQNTLVKALPFEAIECVPGLLVYDEKDFEANFPNAFAGGGAVDVTGAAGQWLLENGETLFFSPTTGVALQDEKPID